MRGWQVFFALAALNNIVVGAALLVDTKQAAALVGVSGPGADYVVGFAGLVIAIFGFGYAIVALAPVANRGLVVIGALGKASALVFASVRAMAGHISHQLYLLSMTDLIWALVFAVFLQMTRNAPVNWPPRQSGSA